MRLSGLRRDLILGTVIAISVIAGTGAWLTRAANSTREREITSDANLGLAFADSLEKSVSNRPVAAITTSEAAAALYLERLRLGLGSPFRLVDQVLRDPALEPVGSNALAEAMLARTLMGDAYWPRSGALDLLQVGTPAGTGAQHQAIIDSVVSSYPDPRVGELAVRLAYRLASASGAVSRRAPELATAAAAQARDRILSMRDARALFAASDRDGVSRITLLRIWRETRKFEVERPVIVPLSARAERDAVASLAALVARIESAAVSINPLAASARSVYGETVERRRSDMLPSVMTSIAIRRDQPPLAPVMIAVRGYSGLIRNGSGVVDRFSRQRFVERVSNEETLAAEYALLTARSRAAIPEVDAALLTAAVALRPFAQERAWLPADNGPTARDLQARFGVAITYDAGTHSNWKPYLQRTLETAILDMRRVLPGFDPRGLHVRFGASPLGDRALALHDPIRRTVYFPPASHSGVMAHEFAHDLDWQAARREYGGTGWYRTDHALRQSVDKLAGALRLMASAARSDSIGGRMTGVARPTEVLARNVDWFVSASLAREGRINGHLSAAQDPVLTGYASAITPEAARDGGSATLRALDGLTSVPAPTRSWFSELFGVDRRLTVHEAVRRVLEAPLARVNLSTRLALSPWLGESEYFAQDFGVSPSNRSWACLVEVFTGENDEAGTIQEVMQHAADSRARGVIRQWSEFARNRPYASPPRLRALTGAPWDPAIVERTHRELRDAILWKALTSGGAPGGWASLRADWTGC
jgi:hypothetical protein